MAGKELQISVFKGKLVVLPSPVSSVYIEDEERGNKPYILDPHIRGKDFFKERNWDEIAFAFEETDNTLIASYEWDKRFKDQKRERKPYDYDPTFTLKEFFKKYDEKKMVAKMVAIFKISGDRKRFTAVYKWET